MDLNTDKQTQFGRVTVIVPVYNEKRALHKTLNELFSILKSTHYEFELIVVDDGSDDGCFDKITDKNIQIICHDQNKGYGAAIKTGIRYATGDILVITDADGTYPISEIPRLLDIYFQNNKDMVVGARQGAQAKIPLIRRPAKWMVNKLANFLTGIRIPDLNSGLRVMNRQVVQKYIRFLPDGFSLTTTITMVMLSNGYEVEYVQIPYYKRKGSSKIRPVSDTLNFIQLILRISMFYNPLKLFLPLSLLFFLMGFSFLIRDIIRMNLAQTSVFLFITGGLILSIGLLADLIIRKF